MPWCGQSCGCAAKGIRCATCGENIKALQTQMGHTDSRVTLSVYIQPMPEAQRQLADKIERVLLPNAAKFDVGPEGSGGPIQ